MIIDYQYVVLKNEEKFIIECKESILEKTKENTLTFDCYKINNMTCSTHCFCFYCAI